MEKLKFGTDGIRTRASSSIFSEESLNRLGQSIACWTRQKCTSQQPHILLAHDTRKSCTIIKKRLISGIEAGNGYVTDTGVLPTPAALLLLRKNKCFDCAIVISASHNPVEDNGIKFFEHNGKLSRDDEYFITKQYEQTEMVLNLPNHSQNTSSTVWDDAYESYIDLITKHFPKKFLTNKKIVLDCAHGATSKIAPKIFQHLGAELTVIYNSPNGENINDMCGSQHPEALVETIKSLKADAGFAFDGDGDRVLAVAQDGTLKDGDDIMAILLEHPDFSNTQQIVGTIMTNGGLEEHINNLGKSLIRTKVGDKYVSKALIAKKLPLGGEPSGHTIIRSHIPAGDGIFTAIKLAETLSINQNWSMNSFRRHAQAILNIHTTKRVPLNSQPYSQIIESHQSTLENGRIVVRYSGTEPLLRIMVEADDQKSAENTAKSLAKELKQALD